MRIISDESQILLIDVQEKLLNAIPNHESLSSQIQILLKGLEELKLPITISEQYPKGLGKTIPELKNEKFTFEKSTFSCVDDFKILHRLQSLDKNNIIICGIEAHVCVMQTAIDLKEMGFSPIVIVDCIASRHELNKMVAIERLKQENIKIGTTESILFELCRDSQNSAFKSISNLIK